MLMDNLYQFILFRFFSKIEIASVFLENETNLLYSFSLLQVFNCIHHHPIFHFRYGIHYQMLQSSSNLPQLVELSRSSYSVCEAAEGVERNCYLYSEHTIEKMN